MAHPRLIQIKIHMTYHRLKRDANGRWTRTNKTLYTLFFIFMAFIFCAYAWKVTHAQVIETAEAATIPWYQTTCTLVEPGHTVCGTQEDIAKWNAYLESEMERMKQEAEAAKVKRVSITLSAYSSRVQETDATPCIAADGTDICILHAKGERICASNDFKMHSVITIEGVGDCIIRDRMNKRYTGTNRVDLYMGYDTTGALKHGVKSTSAIVK